MTLVKVPAEYNKHYGRPLYKSEYNVLKLVHLLEKMKDTLVVKGDGTNKTLHLIEKVEKKSRVGNKYKPSTPRVSTPRCDKDRYYSLFLLYLVEVRRCICGEGSVRLI